VLLEELEAPVVLAPLGGGPSTPRLTAAVSEAGGLGLLAWAYLAAADAERALAETRALTASRFGINVFAPVAGPTPEHVYAEYTAQLRAWAQARGEEIGEPRFGDDDWAAKIDLLLAQPVPVVSFAFGCPARDVLEALREAGSETWVTVTSPAEAVQAAQSGADALIVQGYEAGGHRGGFTDSQEPPLYGLLALLELVLAEVELPVVASGGVATGRGLAAVLAAGAHAAQIGTAFMLAEEAGTSEVHKQALRSDAPTALTRAFTGRLARGVQNRFMHEHLDAPIAYPELHYVTAPLRKRGRERGDADVVNLWAGQTHRLARDLPAGEIVRQLVNEAQAALRAARLPQARPASDANRAKGTGPAS
jgi:nitronate monooxygenase